MARLDLFWITLASMATVTSAIITPYGWVLGNGGETCVQACSHENMGDPKGFDAISNDDALKTVRQMIKGGCGYFTPEHVDQEYAPYLRPPKGDPQERCVRIVTPSEPSDRVQSTCEASPRTNPKQSQGSLIRRFCPCTCPVGSATNPNALTPGCVLKGCEVRDTPVMFLCNKIWFESTDGRDQRHIPKR